MRNFVSLIFLLLFICIQNTNAQYQFRTVKKIDCTEVKSQDRTGTCWSFATASFIESELMRMGSGPLDLSEMFVVRNIYMNKAQNYVLRQGKANFSQGSLSHDLIRIADQFGVVPESVYSGKHSAEAKHNHSEMEAGLKGFLDGVIKGKSISDKWPVAMSRILDVYLGEAPSTFNVNGKEFNPKSYANELGFNAENYVSLSSFTHHPFYDSFILEIPDNYSNGSFYNLPISELMEVIDHAIDKGYSIAWDGDVSEKGFSAKDGIAVLPSDVSRENLFQMPGPELKVTQENRQRNFESYSTTDDHLMHLMGTAEDLKGNQYYMIKNSWGEISEYKGFLYMSKRYAQMKTVAIMLHKEAIPDNIRKKLKL